MYIIDPILANFKNITGSFPQATGHYSKKFNELEDMYENKLEFQKMLPKWKNRVVYEVWEHRSSENKGDLVFGTSVMKPGRVGDEFFLTRGHQHQKSYCAETYFCLSGKGVILMESPDGDIKALKLEKNQLVYVPPLWLHRSVNIGDSELVTLFTYNSDAGQNYEILKKSGGMRKRVVQKDNNSWTLVANTRFSLSS